MELSKVICAFIRKHGLFKPSQKVIAAVSGGPDSIALAHLLIHLRAPLGIHIHLAHFNHKTRAFADTDQRFVEDFARRWEVPLTVGRRPSSSRGVLSEDEARRMRFAFLSRLAQTLGAKAVCLAHNADDAAETVLMRLVRGAGLYGLRGILPLRKLDGALFIRPLLQVHRRQIEAYLKSHHLRFRVDETNLKPVYLRNKIRLQLMPLLARGYNPRVADVLGDLAVSANEDYDFLSTFAQKRFKESVVRRKSSVKISLSELSRQHPAIRRLLLRMMAEDLTGDISALHFVHMEEIEDLLAQRPKGSRVDLPGGLVACKTSKYLEITR